MAFAGIVSVTRPLSLKRIALLHGKAIVTPIAVRVLETILKIPTLDVFNVLDEKRSKCFVVEVSDLGLEFGAASNLSISIFSIL